MQQYFIDELITDTDEITIKSKELYRHLIKVLRMKIGDQCLLVDPNQHRVTATLINTDEILEFKIQEIINDINTEFECYPIVGSSLSKKDKMEWIAQKSTELGAKKIIFFASKFSIMKWDQKNIDKKISRLQEIVKNAAQQSHRKMVLEVVYMPNLGQLIEEMNSIDEKLVAYEEVAKAGEPNQLAKVFDRISSEKSLICLFGPEGGFDPKEIELLVDSGYLKVGLGPRILRAETAPVYFLSALSYKFDLM